MDPDESDGEYRREFAAKTRSTSQDRAGLPWLYGVAKNVLRNQHRTLRRREAALMRLPWPTSDFECVED